MSGNGANSISNPRLLAALQDPGLEMIEAAARACDAAGHRRANLIAGRPKWHRFYLELIDEMRLHTVPDIQILEFCEAVAEAGRQRVYGACDTSVGEALAAEALAEGAANAEVARLTEDTSPAQKRNVWRKLISHKVRLDFAARVFARNMQKVG